MSQEGQDGVENKSFPNAVFQATPPQLSAPHTPVVGENEGMAWADCTDAAAHPSIDGNVSDVIITTPVGTVTQIRGLFGQGAEGIVNSGGKQTTTASASVSASANHHAQHTYNINQDAATHDGQFTGAEPNKHNSATPQHDLTPGTSVEKKHKQLSSGSSNASISPVGVNQEADNGLKDEYSEIKGSLYPVFRIKGADAKDEKCPKDQRPTKEDKRGKGKKKQRTETALKTTSKGADAGDALKDLDLDKFLTLSNDSPQVLDIRTVIQLYERVKSGMLQIQMDQKHCEAALKVDLQKEMEKTISEKLDVFKADLSAKYASELNAAKEAIKKEVEGDVQRIMAEYDRQMEESKLKLAACSTKLQTITEVLYYNQQIIGDCSKET